MFQFILGTVTIQKQDTQILDSSKNRLFVWYLNGLSSYATRQTIQMLDQIVQITNGILNPGTSRSSF